MRARSKVQDTLEQSSWTQERSTSPNGPWSHVTTSSRTIHGAKREMSGFDLENFHSRKREGELLPYTPFYQEEVEFGANPGGTYGPVKKNGNSYYYKVDPGTYVSGLISNNLVIDNLVQQAKDYSQELDPAPMVQAAASKIYTQGHDSLTFLAELHKTAALFKGLVRRLEELTELSKAADNWLEFRYGWRILWYDMVEFHKIVKSIDDDRKRFSDRVGTSQTHVTSSTLSYDDGGLRATLPVNTVFDTSVRGAITADISPPKFQFNPILTGWELITFSFIFDWFVGIGLWLESLSFEMVATSYVAAGGSLVTATKTIEHGPPEYYNCVLGTGAVVDFGGPYTLKVTITTRTPMTIPSRPFANVKLDVFKVVDLLTILKGLAKGFSGSLRL